MQNSKHEVKCIIHMIPVVDYRSWSGILGYLKFEEGNKIQNGEKIWQYIRKFAIQGDICWITVRHQVAILRLEQASTDVRRLLNQKRVLIGIIMFVKIWSYKIKEIIDSISMKQV